MSTELRPDCVQNCPVVCNTIEVIEEYVRQKDSTTHFATSHLDEVADATSVVITDELGASALSSEQARRFLRRKVGRALNVVDTMLARGDALLESLAEGCTAGPLTMQASKGDTTYRVRVCTSANVPVQGADETYEPVKITRLPKTES